MTTPQDKTRHTPHTPVQQWQSSIGWNGGDIYPGGCPHNDPRRIRIEFPNCSKYGNQATVNKANVKFIMTAVRNHTALVEALITAFPYVQHAHSNLTTLTKNPIEDDLNKIKAVLKAVEGE